MKTSRLNPILMALAAGFLLASPALGADEKSPITWKKTVVEGRFRSEGVAVADVNKDGKNDVLVGDFWYEAPSWTKHEIRKPGDFGDGLHSYSKCMATWSADVNGDGWADLVLVGFPGDPALWYENPKGKEGYWPEHMIWHSACNETPLFTDLLGTGKPVLVMGWQPKGKDNEGQMAWFSPGDDPAKPWVMHLQVLPRSRSRRPQRRRPRRRHLHRRLVGTTRGGREDDLVMEISPGSARRGRRRHDPV